MRHEICHDDSRRILEGGGGGLLVTTRQITFHNSKNWKSLKSDQIHPLGLSRCNMRTDKFLSFIWRRSQHLILYCVEW